MSERLDLCSSTQEDDNDVSQEKTAAVLCDYYHIRKASPIENKHLLMLTLQKQQAVDLEVCDAEK